MKRVIKGFITYERQTWDPKNPVIGFSTYKPSAEYSPNTVIVREHSFEVDIPKNFDPRPAMIDSLKEVEKKARADFEAKVASIKRQISELQAIEFTV